MCRTVLVKELLNFDIWPYGGHFDSSVIVVKWKLDILNEEDEQDYLPAQGPRFSI